ncbi:DUF4974 domain-containing protein [Maribellus luteus]|uniref:DUF4974 domain-containing protein n=1 Tax=Maribellus luteus TaxID=2305463 RepID=A0A399SRV2_9BACT|nr:FecR domain-containing protein [Maribellus luteus]RIJ45654.1 DUF4974 domain-containing protein [Maribellus luteus]
MKPNQYIHYTTDDFILDPLFSRWVITPNKDLDRFWDIYLQEHPEQEEMIREAILIIHSMRAQNEPLPEKKLELIFIQILKKKKTGKRIILRYVQYAAAVLLLIVSGTFLYLQKTNTIYFPQDLQVEASGDKGRLITANGITHEFETTNTQIIQAASDKLTINSDTIISPKKEVKKKEQALNQIIIPYGKRSEITLADGTHIWLNSGSQLSYPPEFSSSSREVFLSGEALFEVAPNAAKPFYVITRDIKIRVLGTRFNVSAYNEDISMETVLLNGKVSVSRNKSFAENIEMVPGERVRYQKHDETLSKDQVNTDIYASWISGYLIFENKPTTEVFKKLERYYNQTIIADKELEQITFSGKLDLKDELAAVLENISFASSVSVTENEGHFIIKQ